VLGEQGDEVGTYINRGHRHIENMDDLYRIVAFLDGLAG
jgi:hypothetical protein